MIYTLIIVLGLHQNSTTVFIDDFQSKEICEAAVKTFIKTSYIRDVYCLSSMKG